MISPEGYGMDHEGDSWEELLEERSRLLRSLRRYELCSDSHAFNIIDELDNIRHFEGC